MKHDMLDMYIIIISPTPIHIRLFHDSHWPSAGMAVCMVVVSHGTAPSVPMAKLLGYLRRPRGCGDQRPSLVKI